jgi:hypothetical protein
MFVLKLEPEPHFLDLRFREAGAERNVYGSAALAASFRNTREDHFFTTAKSSKSLTQIS